MKKPWSRIFLIHFMSFQLAFGATFAQVPDELDQKPIEELESQKILKDAEGKFLAFKDIVKGKEKKECEEALSENPAKGESAPESFMKILGDIKEHREGSIYKKRAEEKDEDKDDCMYGGLFDRILKIRKSNFEDVEEGFTFTSAMTDIIYGEKERGNISSFQKFQDGIQKLSTRGWKLKKIMEDIIYDDSISIEKRKVLLIKYLDHVPAQMRDLVLVDKKLGGNYDDKSGRFNDLIPEIPTGFLDPKNESDLKMLNHGPKSREIPLNMTLLKEGNRFVLRFDEMAAMRERDIVVLMKLKHQFSYIKAMKLLTISMMVKQVEIHNAISGNFEKVSIPNSCVESEGVPKFTPNRIEKEKALEFQVSILRGGGYIGAFGDKSFGERYNSSSYRNPLKDGLNTNLGNDGYANALQGIKEKLSIGSIPDIDDFSVIGMKTGEDRKDKTYFKGVVKIIKEKTLPLFEDERRNGRGQKSYIVENKLKGEFFKIFAEDTKKFLGQNTSQYLSELMERKNVKHFSKLISEEMKEKLQKRKVLINMPSLYSNFQLHQWAIRELGVFSEKHREITRKSDIYRAFQQACNTIHNPSYFKTRKKFCGRVGEYHLVSRFSDNLKAFYSHENYIPLRRSEFEKSEGLFFLLAKLWNNLRDKTDQFKGAHSNEYDYLMGQMSSSNKWAMARLGFLLLKKEIESTPEGFVPQYKEYAHGTRRMTEKSIKFLIASKESIDLIEELGEVSGLLKTLRPNYANFLLNKEERRIFWKNFIDSKNEETQNIFSTKVSGKSFFLRAEELNYQTLLTRESLEEYDNKNDIRMISRTWDSLDLLGDSYLGDVGYFLQDIYKNRGDMSSLESIYNSFVDDNFINGGPSELLNPLGLMIEKEGEEEYGYEKPTLRDFFRNSTHVRKTFLEVDTMNKTPIYEELLARSSIRRVGTIYKDLTRLCKLPFEDEESIAALYYSTTKSQNEINKLLGLSKVPEYVMENLGSMTQRDKIDMANGFGAMGLLFGMMIAGAVATGGIGAITLLAMTAGTGGLQGNLIYREYGRKKDGDVFEAQVKRMEDLGFSETGSSDAVSVGWGWTIFESVSVLPFLGIISRSIGLGTKLATASVRSLKNGAKVFKKGLGEGKGVRGSWADVKFEPENSLAQEEISTALHVLKFDRVADRFRRTVFEGKKELAKINNLLKSRKISLKTYIKHVGKLKRKAQNKIAREIEKDPSLFKKGVVPSETKVNEKTAKIVSNYFGGDSGKVYKLLRSYSNKWFSKESRVKKIKKKVESAKKGEKPWGTNWYYKIRYQGVSDNYLKLARLRNEIKHVGDGPGLEKFILENIDDFTDVFVDVFTRKRELPYVLLLQGGPHMGARFGQVSDMADGIIMRKFFNARARLVYESAKGKARDSLGLKVSLVAENLQRVFEGVDYAVTEAISKAPTNADGKRIHRDFIQFKQGMASQVTSYYRSQGVSKTSKLGKLVDKMFMSKSKKTGILVENMSEKTMRKILFSPRSIEEKALRDVIWQNVPVTHLFKSKAFEKDVYKIARELSNFDNVSEMEGFLNAMNLLLLKRNAGVVELI